MQRDERQKLLLKAAAGAFAERGYVASIADIIRRAGVARGTFYLYFENKRHVFECLLDYFLEEIRARIKRIDMGEGAAPPLEQLRENLRRVVTLLASQRDLTKILFDYAIGADPECSQRVQAFYDEVQALIRRAVELGMEMGLVRRCDPKLIAPCILGTIKEVTYATIVTGRAGRDLDEVVDETLKYGIQGIFDFEKGET